MTIPTPGLVHGMTDETYHADPIEGGSLSSTFVRLLTEHVPAKAIAIRRNRKPTKTMNLGKAVHAIVLGAGPRLIVWEHDGRTKEGKAERAQYADALASEGAVAVSAGESRVITGMVEALKAHREVRAILDAAQPEVSAFWQERDTWCRARFDLLSDLDAWDYKTTTDCSDDGFASAMATYGYHQQAEWYQRGLRAVGHPAHRQTMQFICQETEPPYLVQIHTPDELAIEVARALNDRAIKVYAECQRTGVWPGYDDVYAVPAELPAHYFYRHEAAIPNNLNPFTEEVA